MISFRCLCGEPMDVPAEMAGESIQCPVCRRLVDVPTLDNAGSFLDDGTVKMDDAHVNRSALGQKFSAFGGHDDLRGAFDEFQLAGETREPVRRPAATPRYDPITGELILPMAIADDGLKPATPVIDPTAPVLGYARTVPQAGVASQPHAVQWWSLPWQLFGGTGWIAMGVVFFCHAFLYLIMLLPAFAILWTPIALFLTLTIIAHYCNTIDEYGPSGMERVPVLLRTASVSEDVIRPLYFCGIAGLVAFLPLLLAAMFSPKGFFTHHEWVFYALTATGMLLFPVAVFTTICGGTLHNLWPHRMLSAFTAAPGKMILATVAFWLALSAYSVSFQFLEFTGTAAFSQTLPTRMELLKYLLGVGTSLLGYAAAVYLMHLAAAWLGLIYRDHHLQLDWVLQRHERLYGNDTVARVMGGRKPVVTTVDPRRPQIDPAAARPALPIPRQHHGFEVKL